MTTAPKATSSGITTTSRRRMASRPENELILCSTTLAASDAIRTLRRTPSTDVERTASPRDATLRMPASREGVIPTHPHQVV
jgi:hypothetical protein